MKKALAAAVIPDGAVEASDFADVLRCPKEHLSEVVRLREDVAPEKLIADFPKLSKETKHGLACADVIWAGEINGKTVGSLLDPLGTVRFRAVMKMFVAGTMKVPDSEAIENCEQAEEARKSPSRLELELHLKTYNYLKPSDVVVLVTLVLNRWKVRQSAEANLAVSSFLNQECCSKILRINGALLKRLDEGEDVAAHSPQYSSFSPIHDRFLLNREYPHVDVSAISQWALDAGVPLDRISALLKHDESPHADLATRLSAANRITSQIREDEEAKKRRLEFLNAAQWMQQTRQDSENALRADIHAAHVQKQSQPSPKELSAMFEADVKANYPTGFDFKESSVRLVESRVGATFGASLLAGWKMEMFVRPDDLYFYSDMILGDDVRSQMLTRAGELLSGDGFFALEALQNEFSDALRNIASAGDFKAFFCQFIVEKIGGKVRGHDGWYMCFPTDQNDEDCWSAVAARVREILSNAGDALSIDDLLMQLPTLNREVVKRMGEERIADAVSFEQDGIRYLKLVEAYYLPDDFGAAVSDFVSATEAAQSVASIVLLEAMLDERYGEGFRTNYGLEDESVFKQVLAKSCRLEGYEWKRDMFVNKNKKSTANVVDMFLTTHSGLFHEEEFFKFAEASRGMTNRGMLICTFLRKYCIRMAREWWVSEKTFDEMFSLSADDYLRIGNCLNVALSGKKMYPISCLPQSVYDALPPLKTSEKNFEWNPYLLTSVAVAKVRSATVVNDEPSPYTVTAFVVPPNVERPSDVIEYALSSMPSGYFKDADAAFDFLKSNNIRMAKTDKLVAKINEFLGR